MSYFQNGLCKKAYTLSQFNIIKPGAGTCVA